MQFSRSTLVGLIGITAGLLLPTFASAFNVVIRNGNEVRWRGDTTIRYRIHQDSFKNISTKEFSGNSDEIILNAVNNSFQAWEGVGNLDLNFHYDGSSDIDDTGNDGENTLIWVGRNWGEQNFGASYVLAVTISSFRRSTGEITDSDIHFNDRDYDWAIYNPNSSSKEDRGSELVDVETIATHEIGHFIGMDHTSEKLDEANAALREAVMYYASFPGALNRLLKTDDINGVMHLYGKDRAAAAIIDGIYPNNASNTEELVMEINGNGFGANSLPRLFHDDSKTDVVGRIEELADHKIVAIFDLNGLPPGDYDVAVNNGYDIESKLSQALSVRADGSYTMNAETSAGGCGLMNVGKIEPEDNREAVLLLLMMLMVMWLSQYRWKMHVVWQPIRKSLFR